MSDSRQTVILAPSLIGCGALPWATHAHHVDFETGTTSITCLTRNNLSDIRITPRSQQKNPKLKAWGSYASRYNKPQGRTIDALAPLATALGKTSGLRAKICTPKIATRAPAPVSNRDGLFVLSPVSGYSASRMSHDNGCGTVIASALFVSIRMLIHYAGLRKSILENLNWLTKL